MKRPKLIAGNWKMNTTVSEGLKTLDALLQGLSKQNPKVQVALAPPYTHLSDFQKKLKGSSICLAAQNVSDKLNGAYTGEVSVLMLKELGVRKVIIAHSERRQYYGETNESALEKIKVVLKHEIYPIYCVGEVLEDRESGHHFEVVEEQVTSVLYKLSEEKLPKITIAYEPVWAIGTGKTATPEQADEMHAFIRDVVGKRFGDDLGAQLQILYGGSVNAANAANLLAMPHIDGALVGGASLKPEEFLTIIQSAG
ncbi:MAG: triose-phosphate isomerase [Thermaurantimonas sp.]|uniref:triose-phosphate isomerase n=1 Tax=Thermaurantimonas sp. TaxID=2681568 RepID=UPI00391BCE57